MFKLLKLLILCFSFSIVITPPSQAGSEQQSVENKIKIALQSGAESLLGRHGVEKNESSAFSWMLMAAEFDSVEAQVIVAAMYDRGLGVKQDVKKATSWYEKAAKQGHETALALLGKNKVAKGSVAFNYQAMRLQASKQIPHEYAKRILRKK